MATQVISTVNRSSMALRERSVLLTKESKLAASSFLTRFRVRTLIPTLTASPTLAPIRASRMFGRRSCAALTTVAISSSRTSLSCRESIRRWKTTFSFSMRRSVCVSRRSTAFRSSQPAHQASPQSSITSIKSRLRTRLPARSAKLILSTDRIKSCFPR